MEPNSIVDAISMGKGIDDDDDICMTNNQSTPFDG